MKILEVIDRVDRLNPNNYTFDEKIHWCDEVGAVISQEIDKRYSEIRCKTSKCGVELPPDIEFQQIQYGFIGSRLYTKSDLRSIFIRNAMAETESSDVNSNLESEEQNTIDVTIVYLEKYQPIRSIEIYGEFQTNINRIMIDMPPFEIGDMLKWTDVTAIPSDNVSYPDNNRIAVIGVDELGIDTDIEFDGAEHLMYLKRIISESTLAPPPYDEMYVEYVLAKIAYYQQDYNEYSVHSSMYNNLLDSYAKWYKQRNPLDNNIKFNNFWRV